MSAPTAIDRGTIGYEACLLQQQQLNYIVGLFDLYAKQNTFRSPGTAFPD